MATYTTNLNLKKPAASDFYNVQDFNDNADKIDTKIKTMDTALANAANKGSVVSHTVTASGWVSGQYSFESTYPHSTYDLKVYPAFSCTQAQFEAWGAAMIVSNHESNVMKAVGIVPTVNIPVILEVVKK